MMTEICGDNRFEIINKAKEALLESTNIEASPKEMAVLDDFLFRCWQMGWLDKYDKVDEQPIVYDIDKIMEQLERYLTDLVPDETIYEIIKLIKEGGEEDIDWSQVAVDTPILVRNLENDDWLKRHFAKYENGIVYTWISGYTSWSTLNNHTISWKYAKLAEEGDSE